MTSEFMAPTASTAEQAKGVRPGRFAGLRRSLAPIGEARGLPKWVLYIGLAIVIVFVVLAVFAPWISPYGFDQYKDAAGRFPKSGPPSGKHLLGTNIMSTDVLSHIIFGSRTALEVWSLAPLSRNAIAPSRTGASGGRVSLAVISGWACWITPIEAPRMKPRPCSALRRAAAASRSCAP